jgi:hypothetical protein
MIGFGALNCPDWHGEKGGFWRLLFTSSFRKMAGA